MLELLVVLAILGLLVSLVGPRVVGIFEHSKTKAAEIQIANLSGALDLYRLDVGEYPTQQEGLKALLVQPSHRQAWNGPYLSRTDGLLDPWGRPYLYQFSASGMPIIMTLGSDGKLGGTGDDRDITNRQ